jgi:hypothetical protein
MCPRTDATTGIKEDFPRLATIGFVPENGRMEHASVVERLLAGLD